MLTSDVFLCYRVDCSIIAKRWPAQLLSDCGCSEEDAPKSSSSSGAAAAVAKTAPVNNQIKQPPQRLNSAAKPQTNTAELTTSTKSSAALKQKQTHLRRKSNARAGRNKAKSA